MTASHAHCPHRVPMLARPPPRPPSHVPPVPGTSGPGHRRLLGHSGGRPGDGGGGARALVCHAPCARRRRVSPRLFRPHQLRGRRSLPPLRPHSRLDRFFWGAGSAVSQRGARPGHTPGRWTDTRPFGSPGRPDAPRAGEGLWDEWLGWGGWMGWWSASVGWQVCGLASCVNGRRSSSAPPTLSAHTTPRHATQPPPPLPRCQRAGAT